MVWLTGQGYGCTAAHTVVMYIAGREAIEVGTRFLVGTMLHVLQFCLGVVHDLNKYAQ